MYMLILDYEQFLFLLFNSSSHGTLALGNLGEVKSEKRERKIWTTDNQLLNFKPPTFVAMSQSDYAQLTF